ncbi:hypothetical protein D3C87_323310 [compost metagenome]
MPKIVGQDTTAYKRITCRHCGAINEYTQNEVRLLWSGRDYGGGSDGARGFNCGQCGKEIHTERW